MKRFLNYLTQKRLKIAKPFIKGSVLDIGCGYAETYKIITPKNYIGIERNKEFVEKLRKEFPLIKFYVRDIEKDNLNLNGKFDTILLLAVIEHTKKPEKLFKELINSLNKNGKIIITTPTILGDFVHTILSIIGITSKTAVKAHHYIYNYKKMMYLIEEYNLKILKYKKFELGCNSLFIIGENKK